MSLRLRLSIRLGCPDLTVSTNKKNMGDVHLLVYRKNKLFSSNYMWKKKKCVPREAEALCCKLPSPSILQLPIVIYICIYILYNPLKFLTNAMSRCGTVKSILYTRKPKTPIKKKVGAFQKQPMPHMRHLKPKKTVPLDARHYS